jgi:hypothetical protein
MTSFGLLPSSDAAQFLGKKTQWIQVNRKRLGIPHYKIGGRFYYKQIELEAWLEMNHSQAKDSNSSSANQNRFKLAI